MEPLISWLFINVLLALAPIFLKLAIIISSRVKILKWYEVIQDGELYIFSATLSASAIVLPVLKKQHLNALERISISLLVFIILLSSVLFSLASYVKLMKRDLETELNLKIYTIGSIACSILAVSFSYYISDIK
ncbi:MAG: hypothetical protein RM368_26850 [Nostoc sp. DedSLP03]|uniref:hypothetical protein n=1 Tax=Nostoc sp. DedSLP03 TaxID=3075400 RepID=UPI002AD23562|nr:hypothetical protein [Nostoc sp. DedSLP03]MDZ7968529.1 hypothetical protein [Nostoc sp. DedSLP03]